MQANRHAKIYTPTQVEAKQDKAVRFLRDVVGDDDRADDIEDMSLSEYAEHKGIQMAHNQRRETRGKRRVNRRHRQKNSGAERCRQYHDHCVPMRDFAFVGDPSESTTYKLRLDDASHVRNAMARFSHTRIPREYRRKVAERIVQAARRFGIDSSRFQSRYLGRRNPGGEEAAQMYETFHGSEPKEIIEYQTRLGKSRDLAAIGDLIELDLPMIDKTVSFDGDGVILATDPEGTQLFVVGGDQDLSDALDFAPGADKEFVDLGPIASITYRTRKSFDRFQVTDYVHELGEEGGEQPRLVYHALARHILIVGGDYSIAPPGSDGVSPGIIN